MPQILLVPWTTLVIDEFRTPWTIQGPLASALRVVGDGNYAVCGLLVGQNDTNTLCGIDFRQESGAVFPWANRRIDNVYGQMRFANHGPDVGVGCAFYICDEARAFAVETFNGVFNSAVSADNYVTLFQGNNPTFNAHIINDNALLGLIFYCHATPSGSSTLSVDQFRLVIDYTDLVPKGGIMAMEC